MTECPQWRLRSPHYLNVPGTIWEQNETSRETGKVNRVQHHVGLFLNPDDPSDCDRNGDVIVYHEVDGARPPRFGHAFVGEPTPEMEPVNEEAEKISDSLEAKWSKPFTEFTTSDGGEFSERLLRGLEAALTRAGAANPAALPGTQSVPIEQFNELKDQMAALQTQLATLTKPEPAKTERRI